MAATAEHMNELCKLHLKKEHEKTSKPQRGMKEKKLIQDVTEHLLTIDKSIQDDDRNCVKLRVKHILGRYVKANKFSIRESSQSREYWIRKGDDSDIPGLDKIESCPPGAIKAAGEAPKAAGDSTKTADDSTAATARAATGKALTKQEIVDSIAKHTELTETAVEKVLDSLVRHIHWSVSPSGPGKFSLVRLLTATVHREPGEDPEVEIKALKRLNDMAKTDLDDEA